MAYCKFCGVEVRFVERIPRDPDNRDHRETCAALAKGYRHQVRDNNHERMVAQFMGSKGQRYRP